MAEIGLFQYKFMEKIYPKNAPNNDFLEPKMVLDLVFDSFLCIHMVYIIEHPIYLIFLRFLKILCKNGSIFAKNGSRSFI